MSRWTPLEPFIDLYRPAVRIALDHASFKRRLVHHLNDLKGQSYPSLPATTVKAAQRAAFFCMSHDRDD